MGKRYVIFILVALIILARYYSAHADELHITADHLTLNDNERYASFNGNVEVKYHEDILRSQAVKVFYQHNVKQAVTKIEIPGAIFLNIKNGEITGDKGYIDVSDNILVIEGNVRYFQQGNQLYGNIASYNYKTKILHLNHGNKNGKARAILHFQD
jgi:lipopolysaccharide transport protein LptA